MVKVGFLVEGDTEKVIIQSDSFKALCNHFGLEPIKSIFPPNKKERGKDIFKNTEKIKSYFAILQDLGAEYIFCIRDLEDLPCITSAKNEILTDVPTVKKIIVVKKIEAWFWADESLIKKYFGQKYQDTFPETRYPENLDMPDEKFKEVSMFTRNGKGVGDKLLFAKSLVRNGFSIENAAKHPNCPSAKYFIKKLESLNQEMPSWA